LERVRLHADLTILGRVEQDRPSSGERALDGYVLLVVRAIAPFASGGSGSHEFSWRALV
jgi:hypothetical protein